MGIKLFLQFIFSLTIIASAILAAFAWKTSQAAQVDIRWETASEADTAGFNIYRSESRQGPYEKVNADLIPGSPDAFLGGTYHFVDQDVDPGKTYYYRLEDVDYGGTGNLAEVVEVTARGGGLVEVGIALLLAFLGLAGLVLTNRMHKFASSKSPEGSFS